MAFKMEDNKDWLEDTFKELIASIDINKHDYRVSSNKRPQCLLNFGVY